MNYSEACRYLTKKLLILTGQDFDKEDILAYSLEILIINTFNIFLTILLGFFLGVLKSTMACLAVAFLFRHTAGGAHSASAFRCAIITILMFPSISLLAEFLSPLISDYYLSSINTIIVIVFGLLFIYLTPAVTENAPVISHSRKKKLKLISIVMYITVSVLTSYLYKSRYIDESIYISVVLCIVWCVFLMTRYGKAFFKYLDKIKINRGGEFS